MNLLVALIINLSTLSLYINTLINTQQKIIHLEDIRNRWLQGSNYDIFPTNLICLSHISMFQYFKNKH